MAESSWGVVLRARVAGIRQQAAAAAAAAAEEEEEEVRGIPRARARDAARVRGAIEKKTRPKEEG